MTTVRIRPRIGPMLLPILPGLFSIIPLSLNTFRPDSDLGFWPRRLAILLIVLLLVAAAGSALFLSRPVELTPTHLVQRGWPSRSIEWSRIQDVVVQTGISVAVWTDDGRTHRLSAPRRPFRSWSSERFDADYTLIGQWWMEHRGADWQPWPAHLHPAPGTWPSTSSGSPAAASRPGWARPR